MLQTLKLPARSFCSLHRIASSHRLSRDRSWLCTMADPNAPPRADKNNAAAKPQPQPQLQPKPKPARRQVRILMLHGTYTTHTNIARLDCQEY